MRRWIHEHTTWLSPTEELEQMQRTLDLFEEKVGSRPVGYRAPGYDVSPATVGVLEKLAFLYDSSLVADDRPYEINEKGHPTGLVELPVEW